MQYKDESDSTPESDALTTSTCQQSHSAGAWAASTVAPVASKAVLVCKHIAEKRCPADLI